MIDPQNPDDVENTGVSPATERRNKALGLALGAFVIILMVVSYFRISALSP